MSITQRLPPFRTIFLPQRLQRLRHTPSPWVKTNAPARRWPS